MITQLKATLFIGLALTSLGAQTLVDLRTQSKGVDFSQASSTVPFKSGTALPPTCRPGEMFFKTDATAGQNLYGCTSTNTWTLEAGSGGSPPGPAPLGDFAPSVSGNMLTVGAGVARIGNQKYAVGSGGVQFSSGSGDCKTFLSEQGSLLTHCAVGVSGASMGAMVLANVTTPVYPPGAIPLADLTVTYGLPALDSDDRAFLSTKAVQPGAGVSITEAGGVASIATDSTTIPTLGGANLFTGENDFSATTKLRARTGVGAPSAATCDEAGEVGGLYVRADAQTTQASHYVCAKTGASTYSWELTQGGGSGGGGLGDPGANGVVVRTGVNITVPRTITGSANKITVSNGDGVAGNPTINIGSDVVDKTQATTYSAGARQTFQPDASAAGARIAAAALPASPGAGDLAIDSGDGNKLKWYDGTAWQAAAGGGGGGGAPTDAPYLTLAASSTLSAERVLTPRDNLRATDSGANGSYTIDFQPFDRSTIWLVDDFMGASPTSTGPGDHNWRVVNGSGSGSLSAQAPDANHWGIQRITSDVTSGNNSGLVLSNGTDPVPALNNLSGWEFQYIFRIPDIASMAIHVGLSNTGTIADNRIVIKYDTADSDTVFRFQTCSGGTCTTQSSTVTVASNTWYRGRIRSSTAGVILFSVNGETEVSLSTNLPTTNLTPTFLVVTRTGAARSLDADWFAMQFRGAAR